MFRLSRSMKSWWVWGGLSAIALIVAVMLHHASQATAALPDSVRSCLPPNTKFERLAQVQQDSTTYYLVGLNGNDRGRSEEVDTLIQVRQNQCQPVLLKRFTPLSSVVPLEVAKQLELQRYQLWVRSYGKANFQRMLDSTVLEQPLAPEVQWALQQLGLRVPQIKR